MKKRIVIGSAIAAVIVIFTEAAFKQNESFKLSNTSPETTTLTVDRWQITTQVSEKTTSHTTEFHSNAVTKAAISYETTQPPLETDMPCETTACTEATYPSTSENTAALETTAPISTACESLTISEQTTQPPKPTQPQHGDINEKGEMYINGFGWVAFEGTNNCEYSPDMYMNGNKIGYFG